MKNQNNISRSKQNYYVDIISLIPFLLLLITGIIMLIYHTGKPISETTITLNGDTWLIIHKVLAIISIVLICIHLYMHINWFSKLFTGKLKNQYWKRNLTLVVIFIATLITSVIPWIFLGDTNSAKLLLGIHNKLGLLLIVFFIIHLFSYFKWLTRMTKKEFFSK